MKLKVCSLLAAILLLFASGCANITDKSGSAGASKSPSASAKTSTAAVTATASQQKTSVTPGSTATNTGGEASATANGNLLYKGLVAEYGGKIYFTDSDLNTEPVGIRKMDPDGKNIAQIYNENVKYMNIVNDQIFFVNMEGICKIKIDGSGKTVLLKSDDPYTIMWMKAVGSTVYFVQSDSLKKIGADGGTPETIFEDKSADTNLFSVHLVNNKFYYSTRMWQSGKGSIWCYDLTAKSKSSIKKDIDGLEYSIVAGDYIYYISSKLNDGNFEGSYINKLALTGGGNAEQIFTTPKIVSGLNMLGNTLYFVSNVFMDNKYDISAFDIEKKDGEKVLTLDKTSYFKSGAFTKFSGTGMSPMNLNLVGNWIFYNNILNATSLNLKQLQ